MLMLHEGANMADTVMDRVAGLLVSALERALGEEVAVAESVRQEAAKSVVAPVVVRVRSRDPDAVVKATAAQSKGIVHVAPKPPGGELRVALGENAEDVFVWVLVVSDAAVDTATAAKIAGAAGCWVVTPKGEPRQRFRQIAAKVKRSCTGGLRPLSSVTALAGSTAGLQWLRPMLDRTDVEEHTVIAGDRLVSERSDGKIEIHPSPARNAKDLRDKIKHLATFGEPGQPKTFDPQHPTLDMQLENRWRVHAEAFVTDPPFLTLRSNLAGTKSLAELNVADEQLCDLLVEAVAGEQRLNVVIGAQMSAGKTTLCQGVLAKVPHTERIDTIEDTPELRLAHHRIHPFAFERLTRQANADGVGKLTMADHIRAAKRSDTRKLVIGEVRGEGTVAMLDAMSSGLTGCLVTLHADPGDGTITKLEAYAASEGANESYVRRLISSAVHLVLWMERTEAGRRIGLVSQVIPRAPDATGDLPVQTMELWRRDPGDQFAQPVAAPTGAVRRCYLSAGLGELVRELERRDSAERRSAAVPRARTAQSI